MEDGLTISKKAIAKVHNCLLLLQNFQQDNFVHGCIICHPHHEQCILHCISIGIAKEITRLLKKIPKSYCVEALCLETRGS
jgi:hypothetical protein